MLEPRRREVHQIFLLHWGALCTELIKYRLHVHRIPDDHGIGDQIETHRLVGLGLLLFAANHAFIRHEEKIAYQYVRCLADFGFRRVSLNIWGPPLLRNSLSNMTVEKL